MTHPDQPGFWDRLRALGLGLVLAGIGWLATMAPNPPAPLPAGASPAAFSALRALAHVRAIARAAHPIGSPENAAVRGYLSDQLRALRLLVEVQSFTCRQGNLPGANLMARIPGTHTTNQPARAVVLACHYDSVPAGPGASDDGVAVAALLETARALKAGPELRNDVILLFTDGEEVPGELPGAEAFVKSCSWMKEVGCVFNFDARGVSGPELMYETSSGNGPLIREFARTARRPVANSLMSDVYRHMPNDTDFTVFRHAGVPGLNFAFIGGAQHYHRPTDDAAHLSLKTLQHAGSLALGLARHFGNMDLTALRGPDAVYFDLLGRRLIRYPIAWAVPLALLGLALFIGVTWFAKRRGAVSGWKLAGAALAWGAALLLIGALFGYGPSLASRWAHGGPAWPARLGLWPYWFLALGLTTAVSSALPTGLGRWLGSANLALGALWWWLLLALAGAFWLPGGSFVGLWPLLFGLMAVGLVGRETQRPWRQSAWLVVTALPILVLIAPLMLEAYVALGSSAVVIPMLLCVLVIGALSLQVAAIARAGKWIVPVAGLLVALAAVVVSLRKPD